jgi:thiamine biosynthesis protein ThiS
MNIQLNGERYETPTAHTITELLNELEIPINGVAVEVNLNIIKKDKFAATPLNEGDSVEIVNFVGGG